MAHLESLLASWSVPQGPIAPQPAIDLEIENLPMHLSKLWLRQEPEPGFYLAKHPLIVRVSFTRFLRLVNLDLIRFIQSDFGLCSFVWKPFRTGMHQESGASGPSHACHKETNSSIPPTPLYQQNLNLRNWSNCFYPTGIGISGSMTDKSYSVHSITSVIPVEVPYLWTLKELVQILPRSWLSLASP